MREAFQESVWQQADGQERWLPSLGLLHTKRYCLSDSRRDVKGGGYPR